MTIPTFTPEQAPSYGPTQYKTTPEVIGAEFGDGYGQAAPAGLNNLRREASLFWDVLPVETAITYDTFFEALKGSAPFYYTLRGEAVPVLWRAISWGRGEGGAGWVTYTVTLRRYFGNG